jgi:divalent metal cation (Fe/Co/Zn/Cd) transporter
LLAVDIKFRGGLNVRELEAAIDGIEEQIRRTDPTVQRIFIEADSSRRSDRRKAA